MSPPNDDDSPVSWRECVRTHAGQDAWMGKIEKKVDTLLERIAPIEAESKRGGGSGGSRLLGWIVGNWPMLARFVGLLGAIVIVGLSGSAKTQKVEDALEQTQRVAQAVAKLNETVKQIIPAVENNAPAPIPLDNAERTP